jgi:hypothetical protein
LPKSTLLLLLTSCQLAMSVASLSFADEPDVDVDVEDDNTEKCINARILKRTDVVDDQHILFYMPGSKVYLNILPSLCKGLSRERRFSYTTLNRSLCRFDSIRVLSDFGGALQQGRSCRLGYFHLTSKEEIDAAQERMNEPPPIKPPAGADEEEIG